jgi:hypothetical protein
MRETAQQSDDSGSPPVNAQTLNSPATLATNDFHADQRSWRSGARCRCRGAGRAESLRAIEEKKAKAIEAAAIP